MGNIATATSLSIGMSKASSGTEQHANLNEELVSIGEILSSPKDGEMKLIATHTRAMQSYINLLKTDILGLLDQSENRAKELDEHIELLKTYYVRTSERLALLAEQNNELKSILANNVSITMGAKSSMEEKYRAFESEGVEGVIDDYVRAKTEESKARVYIAYIERFQRGYTILQTQNKKILDTLINNRQALIQKSVVVIPDSGSELLKKLNLVISESDYKASMQSS
jgi:hypothetical protein